MAFDFTLDPTELAYIGSGLRRPECVLATARGDLYASHWGGGVSHIGVDGEVMHIGVPADDAAAVARPNGIALCRDGSFLLANLEGGGVYRLTPDGTVLPFLMEVDGQALEATNFVGVDTRERIWITVSTRQIPRSLAYRPEVADGYIVLLDDTGARIAADGLGFTNECLVHPNGEWLYVNETYGRRLTRFRLAPDGSLSGRETVASFGPGTLPDGLTFDAEGGVWLTSVVSNRLIRVAPDGSVHTVLADEDTAYIEAFESRITAGTVSQADMRSIPTRFLKHCSSVAFGGPDLRTVYLGALVDDRIATFRSPVAGHPPPHWRW